MNESNWIDANGLIKPQAHWNDSGNGVLYSAIFQILSRRDEYMEHFMLRCLRGGLLFRSPTNVYQEQWDNHLGLAAHCVFFEKPAPAKSVIWYGLKHFGFFNTDGVLEAKDWLYRFPQIWVLYFLAAFPKLKWLSFPIAWATSKFMNPDRINASGTQLAWLYLYTVRNVFQFGFDKKYKTVLSQYQQNVGEYYGAGHPTVDLVRGLK